MPEHPLSWKEPGVPGDSRSVVISGPSTLTEKQSTVSIKPEVYFDLSDIEVEPILLITYTACRGESCFTQ